MRVCHTVIENVVRDKVISTFMLTVCTDMQSYSLYVSLQYLPLNKMCSAKPNGEAVCMLIRNEGTLTPNQLFSKI